MTLSDTTHPDLDRIREALAQLNREMAEAIANGDGLNGPETTTRGRVDFASLTTVLDEHARAFLDIPASQVMMLLDPGAVIGAAWADAFMAGVLFQQHGGHREVDR